ncbi:hypothetical protein HYT58_00460 [Candidatus Woesearchaeota archaeon]|nr:hypothetical protein [Candidatus Woesearchaeota archaeon]
MKDNSFLLFSLLILLIAFLFGGLNNNISGHDVRAVEVRCEGKTQQGIDSISISGVFDQGEIEYYCQDMVCEEVYTGKRIC